MNVPENLLFTDEHEWVNIDDNIAIIGITDYAQGELGDIVFIEFPDVNSIFKKGDEVNKEGIIELFNKMDHIAADYITSESYKNGKIEITEKETNKKED